MKFRSTGTDPLTIFFTRRVKSGKRTIAQCDLICPSDGLLSIRTIDESSVFDIKNSSYSLDRLLGDEELAKEYIGGTAFVFRLTPAHYHRYVFCVSGTVECKKRIRGKLHSVKPLPDKNMLLADKMNSEEEIPVRLGEGLME